jgi:hypothetical protein
MLGFITGKRSGVSTVPLLVFSLPILPSKSFSFTSKLKYGDLNKKAISAYKKALSLGIYVGNLCYRFLEIYSWLSAI